PILKFARKGRGLLRLAMSRVGFGKLEERQQSLGMVVAELHPAYCQDRFQHADRVDAPSDRLISTSHTEHGREYIGMLVAELQSQSGNRPIVKLDRFPVSATSFVSASQIVHRDQRGEVILSQRVAQFLEDRFVQWNGPLAFSCRNVSHGEIVDD